MERLNVSEITNREQQEKELYRKFDEIFESGKNSADGFIEYNLEAPKEEFLKYLVEKHHVLLHGSNNHEIDELEPRLANCAAKEFGNQKGVYACEDEILPMFYSIKDRQLFHGIAESGCTTNWSGDVIKSKEYNFGISQKMHDVQPWSEGVIYILSRDTFIQGHNDNGHKIDEWMSPVYVVPVAKLRIQPEDFPFFDQIDVLEE